MKSLRGVISDKLRRLLHPGDSAWNPGRPESPVKPAKLPDGVTGEQLGGRPRRKRGRK